MPTAAASQIMFCTRVLYIHLTRALQLRALQCVGSIDAWRLPRRGRPRAGPDAAHHGLGIEQLNLAHDLRSTEVSTFQSFKFQVSKMGLDNTSNCSRADRRDKPIIPHCILRGKGAFVDAPSFGPTKFDTVRAQIPHGQEWRAISQRPVPG